MSAISEEYFREVLDDVAAINNISEWTYSVQKFESVGQNYFGVLIPVLLIGKINGEEMKMALVLKLAPTDERYRVSGAVTLMFAREIFVYTVILQQYRAQQTCPKSALVTPTCSYVCARHCREALALQNMTADGYKPYTNTLFLDFQHVVVALKSLARFHAHSFILKKRNKQLYETSTEQCLPLTEKSNKRYMDVMEDRLNKAINVFENTAYVKLFEYLKRNLVRLVEATSDSVEEVCLCHGDIWKENILFKYESGVPTSACLIDYQTVRMSSPAYDVLYLITSSTGSDTRRQYFHMLLDIYYEELIEAAKTSDLYSEEVLSKDSLMKDLKTVSPAVLIVANTALWLASGLQQEGHVRSKQILATVEEKTAAIANYKTIIKAIVEDFHTYGYLFEIK